MGSYHPPVSNRKRKSGDLSDAVCLGPHPHGCHCPLTHDTHTISLHATAQPQTTSCSATGKAILEPGPMVLVANDRRLFHGCLLPSSA